MKTLYGQKGQPVGSIDEHAFYDSEGRQIGENHEGHLFFAIDTRDVSKGQFAGSYVNGVLSNVRGIPQAFTVDAKKAVSLLPPKIKGMLVDRLRSLGPVVKGLPLVAVPQFLRDELPGQIDLIDGHFA